MGFRWCLNRWRQWACQVQQGSGEGSREGLGGFGAARSGSTGFRRRFRRRFREALVQTCKNKTFRLVGIPPKLIPRERCFFLEGRLPNTIVQVNMS